ncbi:hypothetical protein [Pseudomonas sp. 28 E 9]|jgi:hypothetical protein|nr:hypothetical protein [Pseudomonas sp. 28 E 9]
MSLAGHYILADLDNNLAEWAACQVLVGLTRLFKRVDMVDHRPDVMGVEKRIHPIK